MEAKRFIQLTLSEEECLALSKFLGNIPDTDKAGRCAMTPDEINICTDIYDFVFGIINVNRDD